MRSRITKIATILLALLLAAACGGGAPDGGQADGTGGDATGTGDGGDATAGGDEAPPSEVTISIGTGLGYAPLTIIREEGLLEENCPGSSYDWQQVTGGAATRDGMIAGEIQIGVSGTAPFLVGWAAGVDWKVLASMGQLEFWLMAIDDQYQTLEDLNQPGLQISAPSPDSGQAIAFRKSAQDELGDARAFDDQIAAMGHPEAFQALVNGQTAAAYTSPPFQYRLRDEHDAHRIVGGYDAFGTATFSGVVLTTDFYEQYPQFAQCVYETVDQAMGILQDEPERAAEIIAAAGEGDATAEDYLEWITVEGTEWSVEPQGYLENAAFMEEIGMIDRAPQELSDIAFPTVADNGGE